MARIAWTGAEFNNPTLDGIALTSGTPTPAYDQTHVRSGAWAYKVFAVSSNTAYISLAISTVTARAYFATFWYWSAAAPSGVDWILQDANFSHFTILRTTSNTLQLWDSAAQIGSDSAALSTSTWVRIDLKWNVPVSGLGTLELRLNGTVVATTTSASITTTATTGLLLGHRNVVTAGDVWFDDIIVNDDQGANQNTYAGGNNIVLLVPTSDNARATLWTGGAGGTTNLFDAVNNQPPVGISAETNLTQIKHAGGAAGTTDAYDANMTTYTAAGVPAGATINVLQCVDADGEEVATGTKLLAFSIVSNPAVATSGNVSAGADAGALGTYAANWTTHRGTMTYAPSVTLGTAPVMRALRPETATREADVCFMGILVDYSPPAIVPPRPFIFSQAVQRASLW